MKKKIILSEIELSYEELKCLEAHFQQLQRNAVVRTLQHTPLVTVNLLSNLLSVFKEEQQFNSAKTDP